MRGATLGIFAVPIGALFVTFFLYRAGASGDLHDARVLGALVEAGEGARPWLALRIETGLDFRGIRSNMGNVKGTLAVRGGGRVDFDSDEEGIAEVRVEKGAARPPYEVRIEDARGALLAEGTLMSASGGAAIGRVGASGVDPRPWRFVASPVRGEGEGLVVDVAPLDLALAAGVSGEVDVRVTDAATHALVDRAALAFEPDPGLTVDAASRETCRGWGSARITPGYHLGALRVRAERALTGGAAKAVGTFYGNVPIVAAAAAVTLPVPPAPKADEPISIGLSGRGVSRSREALSVWKAGSPPAREFGLTIAYGGGDRVARVILPGLVEGAYWVVTHAPLDDEAGKNARFLRVGGGGNADTCGVDADALRLDPSGTSASLLLDGHAGAARAQRLTRRLARNRSVAFLGGAALLEGLLVYLQVRKEPARAIALSLGVVAAGFGLLAGFLYVGA